MLMHITNSFQREWSPKIDEPMTRALKDQIINREQEKLDGYVSMGALIGEPKILFLESENSTTDIMNGDFRWDIGHAFKGGATLLIDTLIVRAHGESAAAVKDVDYAIDYTDDLLTIEVKGSLAAAESIDIEITQTLEGCVKIVPLLKGGKTPDSAMLSKVLEAVNAKDTRPMTDKVRAVAPTTVPYDIEITYYTTPDTEAEVVATTAPTRYSISTTEHSGNPSARATSCPLPPKPPSAASRWATGSPWPQTARSRPTSRPTTT